MQCIINNCNFFSSFVIGKIPDFIYCKCNLFSLTWPPAIAIGGVLYTYLMFGSASNICQNMFAFIIKYLKFNPFVEGHDGLDEPCSTTKMSCN